VAEAGGRQGERPGGQAGFLTVQYLAAIGVSLLLLATFANLIAFQYGRGVVRAALDEGARAGSRSGANIGECEQRAEAALDDLLGGPMGDQVRVRCREVGGRVVADATVTFRGWGPGVPDWSFPLRAATVKEREP
jgi:hypothetical protein